MSTSPFIPIIDLAGVRLGDGAAIAAAAAQIFSACTGSGFFYIANHGVPTPSIEGAVAAYQALFHSSSERKAEVAINAAHRGFSARGDAVMYGADKADYKEFFTIGLELAADDEDVLAGQPLRGANNWPCFIPGFQAAISDLYDEMGDCGAALLRAVAVSLGQVGDFFDGRYSKKLQRMQGIYYPPQPPTLSDTFGVADHTDFGCITLLWQDEVGGLEVLDRSGAWIPATPIPGTLVVNVGDLLARWSNDRFVSTRHRVVNRSGRERFSIASFFDPSYDALVDPRELGISDREARYDPVLAGEHIVGRINQSFGYRRAVGAPS